MIKGDCVMCQRQPGHCPTHNGGRDYGPSDADIGYSERWVDEQRFGLITTSEPELIPCDGDSE